MKNPLVRFVGVFAFVCLSLLVSGQNLHYFFLDNVYQRSYFNPALNDEGNFAVASGLGLDISTTGPSVADITSKNDEGVLIVSAQDAISGMNEFNDIFGYTSVNTLDVSINTPFVRISAGHAWKAQAWMQYTRDLAELVTFGNSGFIGETMDLSLQIDYINYNEVYLGFQKSFGPVNVGTRIKRLSGVETIVTDEHKIDLTTSDDIYQLTMDTDFELRSSRAFDYTDIENFEFNVESISLDNFMKNNGGWALDLGASMDIGDRLEVSLGIIDIGSIKWDVEPRTYRSSKVQTFDGIDVSDYITSDEEFVILDSLEALLDLTETNEEFSTRLPVRIYLGGILKLNDMWSVGALIQSSGVSDRRPNILSLNATAKISGLLSVGALYSVKSGNPANLGLLTSLNIGPVTGFLSTDNFLLLGSFKNKNTNIRAGLSIRI